MVDKPVTGEEGRALIRGRVLDAVYVMQPPYPNAIGRIAKTYEALGDGPKDGHHLFQHGNVKPKTNQRMSEKDFRDHLRNVVLVLFDQASLAGGDTLQDAATYFNRMNCLLLERQRS